ncbi:MAG: transposase [Candidatus Dormibacteraceae bacterium]
MEKATQRRYTLEYKQVAVGLVTSWQRVAAAAKTLGIVEQTLATWVKADKAGQLRGIRGEQSLIMCHLTTPIGSLSPMVGIP